MADKAKQAVLERREREARERGWVGPWPPQKPRIEEPADCESYLGRLESGEHRAGFLGTLATKLVDFYEGLDEEHFRRFARTLLDVARDPKAAHRSRLQAVQAAIKPAKRALLLLTRLEETGPRSLQAKLQRLLVAFFEEFGDELAGLAGELADLAGPGARAPSNRVRATRMAVGLTLDTLEMLEQIQRLRPRQRPNPTPVDPEASARAQRRLAEMRAKIDAEEAANGR